MKNLIRIFSFSLAFIFASSLSAQNYGNTPKPGTDPNSTGPTTLSGREFVSTMDYAVIDIQPGTTATYSVYVKRSAEMDWAFAGTYRDVMGGAASEDVVVGQPGTHSLKIVLSPSCANCSAVTFRD